MPRKKSTMADAILNYLHDAPLAEARLTLQFAAAAVRRREPVAAPVKSKKRMARAALKPAGASAPATMATVAHRVVNVLALKPAGASAPATAAPSAAPPLPPPNPPVPLPRPAAVPPPGRRRPRASRVSPAVTPTPPVAQPPTETLQPGDPGPQDTVGDVGE